MLREPLPERPQLQSIRGLVESIAGASVKEVTADPSTLHCDLAANTWTRAARRKRGAISTVSPERPILSVQVHIVQDGTSWALEFCWLRGHDHAAFESFSSHVGRKMRSAIVSTRK